MAHRRVPTAIRMAVFQRDIEISGLKNEIEGLRAENGALRRLVVAFDRWARTGDGINEIAMARRAVMDVIPQGGREGEGVVRPADCEATDLRTCLAEAIVFADCVAGSCPEDQRGYIEILRMGWRYVLMGGRRAIKPFTPRKCVVCGEVFYRQGDDRVCGVCSASEVS